MTARVQNPIIEEGPMDCWVWQATVTKAGYGQTWRDGRLRYAHRLFYEDLVGSIPEGLQIDHLCRNTRCVNPGHLEPVTARENVLRSTNFCAVNAAKTHCERGHEFTPENTRVTSQGYRQCRTCCRERDRRYYAERKKAGTLPDRSAYFKEYASRKKAA